MFTKKVPLTLAAIVLAIILGNSSCENIELFVNCDNCYRTKPTTFDINMKFTINDENPQVNFTVYSGSFEEGQPIYNGTTTTTNAKLNVECNCYYTVIAEYCSNGRSIMAVDGKLLHFKKNTTDCSEECYLLQDSSFDVRLKY